MWLTSTKGISIPKAKDLAKDSELKSEHAIKAFRFTYVWFVVIIAIIGLKGYMKFTAFELSESEFLMTIGTLTTSIFAFYIIVLKYLRHIICHNL